MACCICAVITNCRMADALCVGPGIFKLLPASDMTVMLSVKMAVIIEGEG